MKKLFSALLALIFIFSLPSCGKAPEGAHVGFNAASMAAPLHTKPELPKHSPFYIPDIPVEDVILYFNEVTLDSEIINGGDPSLVQKWVSPVYYTLDGEYTDGDIAVLQSFTAWLNTVEGFPRHLRNIRSITIQHEPVLPLTGGHGRTNGPFGHGI